MIYKFQYSNDAQREEIYLDNKHLHLKEDTSTEQGNFLIFTDVPDIETQLEDLRKENLVLMDALATTFEEVLALKAQVTALQGGTTE